MPTAEPVWVVRSFAFDYGDCEEVESIHATLEGAMEQYHHGQPWKWSRMYPTLLDVDQWRDDWRYISREEVLP